ncbi:50S ribosomal protein L19 [Candidatus Curtissbacteria bacterium RIFCSPHIGHO2_12_FULL_38_9b]|uniref:50S ribosomal protein L19 n=2 Tax=Candidatus Curtissiibacteriota TaxID=1752717 RepID=A0A1F5GXW8_9BACT|nr:MAG: 50S ribosomal protein L19 [Candidatus Curtissbacteria bacterium RIFCSPLOWO2_01_FULL_37_9]OGD96736.1 MAG: 50S ribosomal protein L19 [Candidatus Curtissbacteria bacterium RIFCSPHIGHO2_12_FULL_38_9b]
MEQADFQVGDLVKIFFQPLDGIKVRTAPFEGVVISIRGDRTNKTFCVRKIASSNIAVERIFPLASPTIEKIKVLKKNTSRRAKLYYLRKRK